MWNMWGQVKGEKGRFGDGTEFVSMKMFQIVVHDDNLGLN